MRDLDTIDERAHETTQTVPLDVLDAIDRGRNPEHTTLQVLYVFSLSSAYCMRTCTDTFCSESCSDANNITLGKLNVMAHFRFVYRLVHLFLRSDTNDTGYVSDELDKKITEAGIQLDDKAVVLAEVNEALEKTGTASNSETMQ